MNRYIFILLVAITPLMASAQSNPDEYRNLAAMHIWMSNCEKAQQCYNVYKEISGCSLEKIDVLIAETCNGEISGNYSITYDKTALLNYLGKTDLQDKELIIRVLSMYNDPKEVARQLRQCENLYTLLAKKLDGVAWYDSIIVQKKL